MSFILGGIVFVCTILISGFMLFASGMSDSPSASADANASAMTIFAIGTIIAILIVASHWLPRIGW